MILCDEINHFRSVFEMCTKNPIFFSLNDIFVYGLFYFFLYKKRFCETDGSIMFRWNIHRIWTPIKVFEFIQMPGRVC